MMRKDGPEKDMKIYYINVTNITFTGSAMVNWSRELLIQGVTTVIVVNVHALGHFVGRSGFVQGFRSPRYHNKQDAAEQLQFWFINVMAGIHTGGYQGLPQIGMTPFVHDGVAVI